MVTTLTCRKRGEGGDVKEEEDDDDDDDRRPPPTTTSTRPEGTRKYCGIDAALHLLRDRGEAQRVERAGRIGEARRDGGDHDGLAVTGKVIAQ